MASKNKKNKGRNSYLYDWGMKNNDPHGRAKRLQFYVTKERKANKDIDEEEYDYDDERFDICSST